MLNACRLLQRYSLSQCTRGLASSPDKARVAVVGAGWWAQGWTIPHLHRNPKAVLAAIIDPTAHPTSVINPDLEPVATLSQRYNAPAYKSLEEFLESDSGQSLDGVAICSNHATHCAIAMTALDAGLHVFCEKPMTVDIDEAKSLVAKAREKDCTFMVNNTANWRKASKIVQNTVAAGTIGEIRHATVLFHAPTAWVFNDPANKGWNEPSGSMVGNGFAWGQLSHPLAWLFMASGLTPSSVFAFHGKGTETQADMFDACSILCTNGATVSVSGVAAIPGNSKVIENRFIGTQGTLSYCGVDEDKGAPVASGSVVSGHQGISISLFNGQQTHIPGFEFENTDPEGDGPESLQAFLDACLGQPFHAGADAVVGLKAVAAIDAMYRSAQSGRAEPTHLD